MVSLDRQKSTDVADITKLNDNWNKIEQEFDKKADVTELDNISSEALPTASSTVKGAIKVGTTLAMTGETLNYNLPTAGGETKGGVKVGKGLAVGTDGTLNVDVNNNFDQNFKMMFNKVYPEGAIYMSTSSTDPRTIFGGEWEEWGKGMMPVGVDARQTEFNSAQKTGGHKKMPNHSHGVGGLQIGTTVLEGGILSRSAAGNENLLYDFNFVSNNMLHINSKATSTTLQTVNTYTPSKRADVLYLNATHDHSISGNTASAGSGNAENMPPYITCYMWRRKSLA